MKVFSDYNFNKIVKKKLNIFNSKLVWTENWFKLKLVNTDWRKLKLLQPQ